MQRFDENQFKARVNKALERVKTVLEVNRTPQYPADVPHNYEDKYYLAQSLTTNALSSLFFCLQSLGLTDAQFVQLKDWAKTRSVTLRLKAEEKCKFLRKVVREVQSDTKSVSNSTLFGKSEHYTVTKVTEYFWQFDSSYQLVAFMGTESDKALVLQQRNGTVELKTNVDTTPKPATVVRPNLDVNITWLFQQIEDSSSLKKTSSKFTIDRIAKSCHTPRRNAQIDGAFIFFASLAGWCESIHRYFMNELFPVQPDTVNVVNCPKGHTLNKVVPDYPDSKGKWRCDLCSFQPGEAIPVNHCKPCGFDMCDKCYDARASSKVDVSSINDTIFTPVIPLFEKGGKQQPPQDFPALFAVEEARSLNEKFAELTTIFPANEKLVTVVEAKMLTVLVHTRAVLQAWADGIDYIEDMLRKQLIAAIGKEVGPVDFANYLRFHNRKLFKAEYAPRPFCYAIRRPDHYPEGTLSIEAQQDDGSLADPISTTVAWSPAARPMRFPIDAATQVSFGGDRFLHGWVNHQFSGSTGSQLKLVARARQFSSYIVLVGSIASAEVFEPKYGIIVQNKDELLIPLLLETIPTPKEFRDAIESLSPEQQRFAKAFRAMQLESTLFGVCVLQIKPQLEKLLRLPNDSLTKEIQLSQDLLNLFIEYQVPSDLLSFDGDEAAPVAQKVETVQRYVKNMQEMIAKSKQTQLDQSRQQQQLRLAETDRIVVHPVMAMEKSVMSPPRSFMAAPGGGGPPRPTAMARTSSSAAPARSAPPSAPMPSAAAPPPKPSPAPSTGGSAAPKPVVPATPTPTPAAPNAQQQPRERPTGETGAVTDAVDYTKIPQEMESKFDKLDVDSALRPTIIKAANNWNKKFQKTLLSAPDSTSLGADQQGKERQKCFDLLDALTKSGALSVDYASLHVVIAATHCFDKTLMNTIIQDNVNPIEKVERSSLIVASSIHHTEPAELIAADQVERVATYSPMLIPHEEGAVVVKKP